MPRVSLATLTGIVGRAGEIQEGSGFRCDLGRHVVAMEREGDSLRVEVDGERVIDGTVTAGNRLRLGMASCSMRVRAWGGWGAQKMVHLSHIL